MEHGHHRIVAPFHGHAEHRVRRHRTVYADALGTRGLDCRIDAQVVILDYLQRFTLDDEDSEPRERIGRMMDALRRLASRGLAVIVVSALGRTRDRAGRSSYSGDGLSLASFRETSELEYGADDAFILAPIEERDPNRVRLHHFKARHGGQVTQDLLFNRGVQSFQRLNESRRWPAADWSQGVQRHHFDENLRRAWDDIPSAARS